MKPSQLPPPPPPPSKKIDKKKLMEDSTPSEFTYPSIYHSPILTFRLPIYLSIIPNSEYLSITICLSPDSFFSSIN